MQYIKGDRLLAFSLGLSTIFFRFRFKQRSTYREKISELLSACGENEKGKKAQQLSRFWQNNQWIKHCSVSDKRLPVLLYDLGSYGIPTKTYSMYQYPFHNSPSPLLLNLSCRWIVTSARSQLLPTNTLCLLSGCPILNMPKSSSIREAKAWAALAKATSFIGCQRRAQATPHPWRNWEISVSSMSSSPCSCSNALQPC